MMKAAERIYLNADKSRAVPEGHKDAAFLYAAIGDEIPDSAAEKYRLTDGRAKPEGKPAQKPEKPRTPKSNPNGTQKPQTGATPKDEAHELTKVKGIGAGTAKALAAAGVDTIAALAGVDPASPPALEGWRGIANWQDWVAEAKALGAPNTDQE
ncbi:helix-hairpin-helix domain-containing protein [Pelagibacterium halotolerans]|uniref:DUF4332 domain-containing protein n=1 Tax=Pelagibacterium halotolerans (strain DSM 22347 / JCM 15775 / CGMCC 1.7692 / B2) TaxID=1082931 RepID=G4RDD2_PELHB|nr:helix-hairpin-helix domain-containing protein [Pelagibacterium halotolerans]AEQ50758.1 hypothetical protein KKY_719 [Pelagibacterium halotolerans B2]QJR19322.1 hypothetical protein HKM20_13265 [Pelagibacterium halotolerans]SDZ95030.1 Helix-hairpin-helix domain-containing protein [Pelagibacterium halotolerans]